MFKQILASAARTASPDAVEVQQQGHKGAILVIDVTAITATPSITVTVRGVDPLSGKTWDILTSSAISTVSTNVLKIYPGLTASANEVADDVVPSIFEVDVVHTDADSITYSIGAQLVA